MPFNRRKFLAIGAVLPLTTLLPTQAPSVAAPAAKKLYYCKCGPYDGGLFSQGIEREDGRVEFRRFLMDPKRSPNPYIEVSYYTKSKETHDGYPVLHFRNSKDVG